MVKNHSNKSTSSDDPEMIEVRQHRLYCEKIENRNFDYYIDTYIGDISEYRDLLHVLHTANESDEVNIWVDTGGGALDTALGIINAMEISKASVRVLVMGKAYSAGSLIALAAMSYGDLVILPRSRFMIHSATLGPYGKENEVEASLKANLTEIRALKKEFYTGFLSDLEMQELDKGRDYYFNAAQSRKRALSRVSYLESVKKKTIKAKKTKESDSEDEKVNF